MKRLLIPLLTALALPTAVNAESHWLVLTYGSNSGSSSASLEKIEMPSAEFCEKEGRRWENSPTHGTNKEKRKFHCVVCK